MGVSKLCAKFSRIAQNGEGSTSVYYQMSKNCENLKQETKLTSKSLNTSLISGFLAREAARRLLTVLFSLLTRLLTAAACSRGRGLTASPSWASVTSRPAWNGAAKEPRPAACSHSVSSSPSVDKRDEELI